MEKFPSDSAGSGSALYSGTRISKRNGEEKFKGNRGLKWEDENLV